MIAVDPNDALTSTSVSRRSSRPARRRRLQATGPYWNFEFRCRSISDATNTCSPTTHADQHSIAFGNGFVYVGNDGGVYRRGIRGQVDAEGHATDWASLNANLRTLQDYSVGSRPGAGRRRGRRRLAGQRRLAALPEDLTGNGKMGSPFGGDGGDIIVDPDDGCKILDE